MTTAMESIRGMIDAEKRRAATRAVFSKAETMRTFALLFGAAPVLDSKACSYHARALVLHGMATEHYSNASTGTPMMVHRARTREDLREYHQAWLNCRRQTTIAGLWPAIDRLMTATRIVYRLPREGM